MDVWKLYYIMMNKLEWYSVLLIWKNLLPNQLHIYHTDIV